MNDHGLEEILSLVDKYIQDTRILPKRGYRAKIGYITLGPILTAKNMLMELDHF